jgi:hypothetical protein
VLELGIVGHACNPSIQEAETLRIPSFGCISRLCLKIKQKKNEDWGCSSVLVKHGQNPGFKLQHQKKKKKVWERM